MTSFKVDGKRNTLSCKLKAGVQCSPSVGPCCDDTCSFISKSHNQKCKEEQVIIPATIHCKARAQFSFKGLH